MRKSAYEMKYGIVYSLRNKLHAQTVPKVYKSNP